MRSLILASAAVAVALPSAAAAQQKSVTRAEAMKNIDTKFAASDTNHDGFLSKAEIGAEEQREVQRATARIRQQLEVKFKQLDTNKDGQLNLAEFLAATPSLQAAANADQVMQKLDSNHDGKISAEEMRAPQITLFNRADTNHDGILTATEMKAMTGQK